MINISNLYPIEKLHFNMTSSDLMLFWETMDLNTNTRETLTGGHFKCKRRTTANDTRGGDVSAHFKVLKSLRKIYMDCTKICTRLVLDGTASEYSHLQCRGAAHFKVTLTSCRAEINFMGRRTKAVGYCRLP